MPGQRLRPRTPKDPQGLETRWTSSPLVCAGHWIKRLWADLGGKISGAEMSRGQGDSCPHGPVLTTHKEEERGVLSQPRVRCGPARWVATGYRRPGNGKGSGEGVSRGNLPVPLSPRGEDVCQERAQHHTHSDVTVSVSWFLWPKTLGPATVLFLILQDVAATSPLGDNSLPAPPQARLCPFLNVSLVHVPRVSVQ